RPREEADEPLQHLRQLVAGQILEDLHRRARVATAPSADEDVDAVDDLPIDLHLASLEADVRGVVVAAGGRAAGPPDRERPHTAHLLLELARERHGARLGI